MKSATISRAERKAVSPEVMAQATTPKITKTASAGPSVLLAITSIITAAWPPYSAMAVFVIFGVVACAITSGDTAFRSARLIVADFMGVEQRTLRKRIYICIPLFALGLLIIFGLPFQTMWSYFAWMNQTLAAVTLWMIVAYLRHRGRAVWVGLIPALVMTYVCASYIFVSPLMLGMQNRTAAYLLGGGVTLAVLVAMIFKLKDNDAKGIS